MVSRRCMGQIIQAELQSANSAKMVRTVLPLLDVRLSSS